MEYEYDKHDDADVMQAAATRTRPRRGFGELAKAPIGNRVIDLIAGIADSSVEEKLQSGQITPQEAWYKRGGRRTPEGQLHAAQQSQGPLGLLMGLAALSSVAKSGEASPDLSPLTDYMKGSRERREKLATTVDERERTLPDVLTKWARLEEIQREQQKEDARRAAYGGLAEGIFPGLDMKDQYMRTISQEDPDAFNKMMHTLLTQRPQAEDEADAVLTSGEVSWLEQNGLGHLSGDPQTARSVMAHAGKHAVTPKEPSEPKPTQQDKDVARSQVDMDKVEQLFSNLWDRKKEQLGSTGSGPLVGAAKKGLAKIRAPGGEATAAYAGQVTETAAALNRIVTGQNRVVESIYNRLAASLPDIWDTETYAKTKLEQSIRNSYGLMKAVRKRGINLSNYSDEDLANPDSDISQHMASMAPEALDARDNAELQGILDRVFGGTAPPKTSPGAVRSFGSVEEAEAANLPKGTRITIGGRSATVQ